VPREGPTSPRWRGQQVAARSWAAGRRPYRRAPEILCSSSLRGPTPVCSKHSRRRRHHPIFGHLHSSQRPEFISCLRNFEPTALPFQDATGRTCLLCSAEALLLERLTKSGTEGQIIVLSSDLNNKLNSAGAGAAPRQTPARSPGISGQPDQPLLLPGAAEPRQKERWRTPPCQATHYCRLPVDYTFPLPKNNSKQIRHSICLGQLPQTVRC